MTIALVMLAASAACGKGAGDHELAVPDSGADAGRRPVEASVTRPRPDAARDHRVDARRDVTLIEAAAPDSSAGCVIVGVSYRTNEPNPTNACQTCQPAVAPTAWTSQPDGARCGADGSCFGGVCMACPVTCSNAGTCAVECDEPPAGYSLCCDASTSTCFYSAGTTCPAEAECPSTCTSDAECQSQCPAATAGSVNCCDVATGACFESTVAECPTPVCPTTCTADSQCQGQCPTAPAGSVNCCDTKTGACFQSATSTCPQPQVCPSVCTSNSECEADCPAVYGSVACCYEPTSVCFESALGACPGQCPSACSTDSQCAATCPAAPAGYLNCCDSTTRTCFQSPAATCPE